MQSNIKPESILRKANDLIHVGHDEAALLTLHEYLLSNRKGRTMVADDYMMKYIDLAVKLKKNIKDGLLQYRYLAIQSNAFNGLEVIVKYFIDLAEKQLEDTKALLMDSSIINKVSDLEEEEAPEVIIMRAVSGEDTKERKDRELLTPALKYVWEAYQICLDLLRHNSRVDEMYQSMACQAFNFCKRFKRTAEFRRVTNNLRIHLEKIPRLPASTIKVNLKQAETCQSYLETRFEQLKVATELELWQEAYHSIEDIHGLISMSKRAPPENLMALYFEKIAQIFWVSENYLFHAYALFRCYTLSLSTNDEALKKRLASTVLMAALVIPDVADSNDSIQQSKDVRLASLLGFSQSPSRSNLLLELVDVQNILNEVGSELKQLYHLFEKEFCPLELNSRSKPFLKHIESTEGVSLYVTPLKKLVVFRLLRQAGQLYSVMKVSSFLACIPEDFTFSKVEQMIVVAVKNNCKMNVMIDHRKQLLHFGKESSESSKNCYATLTVGLEKILNMIKPTQQTHFESRIDMFQNIASRAEIEHEELLGRQNIIENRKQEAERILQEKLRFEEEIRQREENERKEKEEIYRKAEVEKLKKIAEEKAQQEADRLATAALVADLEKRLTFAEQRVSTVVVTRLRELLKQHADKPISRSVLLKAQTIVMEDERKYKELKNDEEFTQYDYLVRSVRAAEKSVRAEANENKRISDRKYFAEQLVKARETALAKHNQRLEDKAKLLKAVDIYHAYHKKVVERKEAQWKADAQKRAEVEAAKQAALKAEREKQAEKEAERKLQEEKRQKEAEDKRNREEEDSKKDSAPASSGRPRFINSAKLNAATTENKTEEIPAVLAPVAEVKKDAEPVSLKKSFFAINKPAATTVEPVRAPEPKPVEQPVPSSGGRPKFFNSKAAAAVTTTTTTAPVSEQKTVEPPKPEPKAVVVEVKATDDDGFQTVSAPVGKRPYKFMK